MSGYSMICAVQSRVGATCCPHETHVNATQGNPGQMQSQAEVVRV